MNGSGGGCCTYIEDEQQSHDRRSCVTEPLDERRERRMEAPRAVYPGHLAYESSSERHGSVNPCVHTPTDWSGGLIDRMRARDDARNYMER